MAITLNHSTTYRGFTEPTSPQIGDSYSDIHTYCTYVWSGSSWMKISYNHDSCATSLVPTQDQLDNFPALRQSWEEYLVVRKLLGI